MSAVAGLGRCAVHSFGKGGLVFLAHENGVVFGVIEGAVALVYDDGHGKVQVANVHAAEPFKVQQVHVTDVVCLLYTSPSPRDRTRSRMPSSA